MTDETVQAVEPPAPDANANEADTATNAPADSSTDAADSGEKESKVRGGFQRRIDRLTRDYRDTERDRDHWREMAMRFQQSQAPQPEAPKAKTLADFEYDEGRFQNYLLEQATARATAAARKQLEEENSRKTAEQRRNTFIKRETDYANAVEDYYEVTRGQVPITAEMAEVIAESADGPALAYHLGKNLALAEQISQMSPLAQARELGRLEAKLAHERQQAEEAKRRVSQAPPPTPKIDGADPKVEKDPSEMTDVEFAKWRRKQIAARR